MSELSGIDSGITNLFQEVVQVMWNRLTPILGLITTQYLFQQAVTKNRQQFPWLEAVNFRGDGPQFHKGEAVNNQVSQQELRKGFAAIVTTVLAILTTLSGDILVNQLKPQVEVFLKKAGEEA